MEYKSGQAVFNVAPQSARSVQIGISFHFLGHGESSLRTNRYFKRLQVYIHWRDWRFIWMIRCEVGSGICLTNARSWSIWNSLRWMDSPAWNRYSSRPVQIACRSILLTGISINNFLRPQRGVCLENGHQPCQAKFVETPTPPKPPYHCNWSDAYISAEWSIPRGSAAASSNHRRAFRQQVCPASCSGMSSRMTIRTF